jgi:hypothetical protein
MNLKQVLSFLENEEKRNRLIAKLKNAGENSKPLHALKDIITSFNLHKAQKEIHQKNILQTTFRYLNTKECFHKFRLVCNTWKRAIETMRFHKRRIEINNETLGWKQNGNFAIISPKYLRIFKRLTLEVSPEILLKWSNVSKLILQNMKNLTHVTVVLEHDIPPNFENFLYQLFENSQNTITKIEYRAEEVLSFPNVSLPNLTHMTLKVPENNDTQIENFDKLMKNILKNCEYLKKFFVHDINNSQQIKNHISANYSHHCLYSDECLETLSLPMQATFCTDLSDLSGIENVYAIKALGIDVDFNFPYDCGWDNYKTIFQLFPNLKFINISEVDVEHKTFDESMKTISSENQKIWKERVTYLKSRGIDMIGSWKDFNKKVNKISIGIWSFRFYCT